MPILTPSKDIFISYRRSVSQFVALSVYQHLSSNGFDVFYDIEGIDTGKFDTIILNQIAARPYFLPILMPGSLERCKNDGDWLLREITEALRLERAIIPLHTAEFDFADIDKYLPVDAATAFKRWNAVEIPAKFFRFAMQELSERLTPIAIAVTPTPKADIKAVEYKQELAAAAAPVTEKQLTAEEYFLNALLRPKHDQDGAIADYDEAIRLNPKYAEAYFQRGISRTIKGDFDGAFVDYNKAIQLNPKYIEAYFHRGLAHAVKGDFDGAFVDYSKAIQLNPKYAEAYFHRAVRQADVANYQQAIVDIEKFLELAPNDVNTPQAREFLEEWRKLLK